MEKPRNLRAAAAGTLPVILALILHRFFHIIDNRFVASLGNESLLLHNIQFTFVSIGQFLGMGTAMSLMIFWNRPELAGSRRRIFQKHAGLLLPLAILPAGIALTLIPELLSWYEVLPSLRPTGRFYLALGILNAVLQALMTATDGLLVSSRKQRYSMYLAAGLLAGNWLLDYAAIAAFRAGLVENPLLYIGGATTLLSVVFLAVGLRLGRPRRDAKAQDFKILDVWGSETLTSLVRCVAPSLLALQLAEISASRGFLNTYNLALHLAYIACLPLIGASQIAVREASAGDDASSPPSWWNGFLYVGIVPTAGLLLFFGLFSSRLLSFVYNYVTPPDHVLFLPLFFLACLIGQTGHIFAVPLRAAKKSKLVLINFTLCELVVLLGGHTLLLARGLSTPLHLAYLFCFYAFTYAALNGYFASELSTRRLPCAKAA